MRLRLWAGIAFVVLLAGLPGVVAAAPATRAEAWRLLREEKVARLHAYVPKAAEKFAVRFEDELLPRLVAPRSGFFPFVGRITSGGGFAVGPGYRLLDVAGGDWVTSAAASIKGYWQVDTRLVWSKLAHGRAFATTYGRFFRYPARGLLRHRPGEPKANRVDFDHRQATVGFSAGVRPRRWLTLGGTTEFFRPRLGPGGDNHVPNIDEVFDDVELPGFARAARFVRLEGFADVRTAEPTLNPRRGGQLSHVGRPLLRPQRPRRSASPASTSTCSSTPRSSTSAASSSVRALGSFSDVAGDGGDAVLLDADARRRPDAARLPRLPLPRPPPAGAAGRVSLRDPDGARRRRCSTTPGRSRRGWIGFRWRDFERDWGFGVRFGGNGGVFLRLDLAFGGERAAHLATLRARLLRRRGGRRRRQPRLRAVIGQQDRLRDAG